MKTKITILTSFLFLGINISFGQWTELPSNTQFGVDKIDCVDGMNCFLGSAQGVVRKTIDGGTNWTEVDVNGTGAVQFLKMFSPDTCYVFDTDFFRTADGGQNWTQVPFANVVPIFFLNTSIGFGTGSGSTFYKTTDKGDTWTQLNTIPSEVNRVYATDFLDEMNGFICARNTNTGISYIYKTINGGGSWTKVFERTTTTGILNDIEMASSEVGIVCGLGNTLLRTSDGGDTWNDVAYPLSGLTNLFLWSVDFINSNSGYVVGSQNAIMKTIDGGQTWIDESYPLGIMNEVSIATLDTVYVATGQNIVLKNSNADLVVNIHENDIEIGKIYPNPVIDVLNIEILKENAKICVFDGTGKETLEKDLSIYEVNSINLTGLEKGIYFYRITSKNETLTTGKFSKN